MKRLSAAEGHVGLLRIGILRNEGFTVNFGFQSHKATRVQARRLMSELWPTRGFTDFVIGCTSTVTLHENAGYELRTPRIW